MTPIRTERLRDYSGVVTDTDVWSWFTLRNVSTTLRQWHLDFKLDFLRLALVG